MINKQFRFVLFPSGLEVKLDPAISEPGEKLSI